MVAQNQGALASAAAHLGAHHADPGRHDRAHPLLDPHLQLAEPAHHGAQRPWRRPPRGERAAAAPGRTPRAPARCLGLPAAAARIPRPLAPVGDAARRQLRPRLFAPAQRQRAGSAASAGSRGPRRRAQRQPLRGLVAGAAAGTLAGAGQPRRAGQRAGAGRRAGDSRSDQPLADPGDGAGRQPLGRAGGGASLSTAAPGW